MLGHEDVVDRHVGAVVDIRVTRVAQRILAQLDGVGVVQAFSHFHAGFARCARAHDDGRGDGIGDVVEVTEHDARTAAVAQFTCQHAQGHRFRAAPLQRAQVGQRVAGRIVAVAMAVVGPARFQVHHDDVGELSARQDDRHVQGRAGEAAGVVLGGHAHAGRKIHPGNSSAGQRQARHERHRGQHASGRIHRIVAGQGGCAVMARARQHVAQGRLRENFLETDHVGVEQVDLPRRPFRLGVVLRRAQRFQVVIQFRPGGGKVADIECGKADFLLHN